MARDVDPDKREHLWELIWAESEEERRDVIERMRYVPPSGVEGDVATPRPRRELLDELRATRESMMQGAEPS